MELFVLNERAPIYFQNKYNGNSSLVLAKKKQKNPILFGKMWGEASSVMQLSNKVDTCKTYKLSILVLLPPTSKGRTSSARTSLSSHFGIGRFSHHQDMLWRQIGLPGFTFNVILFITRSIFIRYPYSRRNGQG
ncbi:hypothetical protein CDAR_120021 [Caerostris darwini]|uniref:Transmembrane protein n=1 Tax=Caerostris darwini TaxID=1538125 RepID=A0AAV4T6T6_9ARAC|nr:hypothetical protein CDAR_120021 [Caerostris darwini]